MLKPPSSGNTSADAYIARRRVTDAFLRAALESFHKHGPEALACCAKDTPASYLKIFALLVPKEMRIEHTNPASALSDEQLALMVAELEERIAARLSGEEAKVINAGAATAPTALPPPANEALCDTTGRRKRTPKSTPERLAYAREYKRQRAAGNPNPAAAARAVAQAVKRADKATPTSGG